MIMAALKIGGMDSTVTAKEYIGALAGASLVKHPFIEIKSLETHNECLQHKFKKNEVIVGTQIVERVEWKWQEKHEYMKNNIEFLAVVLTMICVLICLG